MEEMGNKRIIIVGDLFPVPSNYDRYANGDVQYLFGKKIVNLFSEADYRICNLEGALTDRFERCEKTGPVVLAPTKTVNAIKNLGIDCCALANNHITDAGHQGVLDTMQVLNQVGIRYLGAGGDIRSVRKNICFMLGERTIGLYNVCETMYNAPTKTKAGANLYDEYLVCRELETLKQQCDYLIVIYHGGAEKFRYPSPQTRKRFHRMVDSGANMVLSQHTHCVGSEEYYKGAYLLYGQGNFLFRSFNNEFTNTGLIVEVEFCDEKPIIKKYLVNAVDDTVRYDDSQDFSDFDRRSSQLMDEEFLAEQYRNYCLQELPIYFQAYKGRFWGRRIVCRLFPKLYKHFLLKYAYNREDILFTLHSLRSEQNRETAVCGMESLLASQ